MAFFSSFISLRARWRSAPRVEALTFGFRRALAVGISTFGLLEVIRPGSNLFDLHSGLNEAIEALVTLSSAAVAAIVAGSLGARLGTRRNRISRKATPSADRADA